MALEYIKHNREVTSHDLNKYGKIADHDLLIPCLLLYELGEISDKNGKIVDVNRDFIISVLNATNEFIIKRSQSPYAQDNQQWGKPLNEVNAIPIIKNHDTQAVEDQAGYSEGLLYTEEKNGILGLWVKTRIIKLEDKRDVLAGLLRAVSIGTRGDGSVKEVSFVSNEAAPICGLQFSEPTNFRSKVKSFITGERKALTVHLPDSGLKFTMPAIEMAEDNKKPELELSEQIKNLQLAESNYENKVIPNHVLICKMIKAGKIKNYDYERLINKDISILELMDSVTVGNNYLKMRGTSKQTEYVDPNAVKDKIKTAEVQFQEKIAAAQKKLGIKPDQVEAQKAELALESGLNQMIRQNYPHELQRQEELKYILELSESSPKYARAYIQCELGEEVENPKYSDTLLSEYIAELKKIKTKLNEIQF